MQEEDQLLECPICFEQMTEIASPYSPSDEGACNHSFCMSCMKGIYELSQNNGKFPKCPICRRTISSFVRNQLATQLVASYSKVKVNLRDVKVAAVERERHLTTENENMAQHISELEGELVRSNANNQSEIDRSVHMKKMLHLLEGEKSILSEHLQEIQKEAATKARELEESNRRVTELEEMTQRLQDDSSHANSSLEEATATVTNLQTTLKEREREARRHRDERKQAEHRISELEDYIERSDAQIKKTLNDFEKVQSKVGELEQVITTSESQLRSKTEELMLAEKSIRDLETRLKYSDAEARRSKEDEAKLERRMFELESIARKSDSERANNGAIVSQLEDMLNRYKQEVRTLEEEKYDYSKKVAVLEGSIAKFKIDLRKAEDERNGYKERAWKAERDAEIYKKEMEKTKAEFKENNDTNKQSGYLAGFMKKSLTLSPLTALWGGETKPIGPLVRSFSDLLFFERRGSTKDSCVWRGKSKSTGSEFAIKRITDSAMLGAQAISDITLFREALILKKIDHSSVTKIDSVVLEKGCLYFTYTPFVSMDLEYATTALKLNALQIKTIMYQLLCVVSYLHRQELVHRNLKPTTVLMTDDCNIKLCGFSQARSVLGGKPTLDLYIPTQPVNYTAPEVFTSEFGVSIDTLDWKAADIWSIGCIFVELLIGEPLFSSADRSSYLTSVANILDCAPLEPSNVRNGSGLYPPSYKTLSVMLSKSPQSSHPSFRMAVEVIENMLQFESSLRSDAQRLLQHKADLSRGRDISREVGDNCIQHFIDDYCTGIM